MPVQTVYLDTNLLRQLTSGPAGAEFIELRDSGIKIFVPDVAVREWTQQRIKESNEDLNTIDRSVRKVERLLGPLNLNYEKPRELEHAVSAKVEEFLRETGIQKVPTPSTIDLEQVITMAIKREPPFEERKEKGFKDAIILFTILEHMKSARIPNAILLSADKIFLHDSIAERVRNNGLELRVLPKFSEAVHMIKAEKVHDAMEFLVSEGEKFKPMLARRMNQISDFILRNAEVSEGFLKRSGIFGKDELPALSTIQRVLRVRPKEIANVIPGFLKAAAPQPEGTQNLTISVSIDFDLLLSQFDARILVDTAFPLSDPSQFEARNMPTMGMSERELTVTRQILVEARATVQKDEIQDLELLSVSPWGLH